ncbi:MAG: hypothetical protein K0V04_46085, partial [Deltaproteobacteria bacterium]|nr:hypothetical protein [Deltaproteobacteria bacterium]
MKTSSQPPLGWGVRRVGSRPLSRFLPSLSLCAAALASTSSFAGPPDVPFGKGTVSKGKFTAELYRGAAVPFELTVFATPNDCQGHMDLQIAWNEANNRVVLDLQSDGALEPFPDVDRTEGVNFLPNPFFPEPIDFVDGRYQLWIISAAGPITLFLYDPITLDLLGSIDDFAQPPPAIPVPFPTLYMVSTPMFQADANGDADLHWEFDYDGVTRGDRPEFSHHLVTFPPPNLCGANPDRLDLSTLRPFISAPLP